MNLQTEISSELWRAVSRSYESQLWSNAILDSIHFLADLVRSRTGLQSDGVSLVGQALGGKAPKLRLNRLQTESEQNVQAGAEQLLRGLFQAIRNPRSHDRLEDTRSDADAIVLFVDYLLRLIGHARSVFSIDECVARIIDENFVPNARYADLIVNEIPARQRLQVALHVLRRKTETDGTKLQFFFASVLDGLSAEDRRELLDAVSTDLKESSDDTTLRSTLQLLKPEFWIQVDEAARLRTEHRILRNFRDGRYSTKTGKCSAGSLATWSTIFWKHFTLKNEMLWAVYQKLSSSDLQSQDYALKFGFDWVRSLADKAPSYLRRELIERLKAGDTRFKNAIERDFPDPEFWSEELYEAARSFQASEPVPDDDDDDLPF